MKLIFKIVLLPFAVIYGLIVRLRHWCYNIGVFKVHTFAVPTICVGNVAVGGTGKSPMVEYLIRQLKTTQRVGVLSRGYKRKSKGFVLAEGNSTVYDLGDEPFQFWKKFKDDIILAVCGSRVEGIEQMLALPKPPEVIILDDAFQHRPVKAKINIILTAYGYLFTNDWLLPMGRLRDVVSRVQQADIVVVTKCPTTLSQSERSLIEKQLQKKAHCPIVFATIAYDEQVFKEDETISLSNFIKKPFTLVTGIANPQPLLAYLKEQGADFQHLAFADHHHFTEREIQQLQGKRILTTEKDYVRLQPHLQDLYYLPIAMQFLTPTDEHTFGTVFENL
ncbi:tetraacyldisaccharide 4'-kinase [Capnocytophaga sp. oral taxon 335 str. F0486]|jgi:tetraacyldisaccharide 4'-kinase|uniref:tetraacyldisaccharide 4'-kinase n=1 Tax=Capnocytophaga sp. oral taxon 335 TaxID=712215 RepID=UPI00026F27D3|nr:tetraacyldisaccharide 4'-kinase [Capnocytophaga sp. oral taxon 335]EJF35976.1 tetraacyldisaccharide 4'-kinase [Capnocytophaga sp. oral taxon 335 str. F0486]